MAKISSRNSVNNPEVSLLPTKPSFETKTIEINRISRTVAGGRRLRFRAAVIGGDRNGRISMGIAKGNDVNMAVKKATSAAQKHTFTVLLVNGTIARPIRQSFGSTTVYLKPTRPGSSVIAGGSARTIFDLLGVRNVTCKIIGSTNKINVAYATLAALKNLSINYPTTDQAKAITD